MRIVARIEFRRTRCTVVPVILSILTDLNEVVCGSHKGILRRVGLPKRTVASRLLPFERGFCEAARAPGRLLWMPLEQFTARASGWRTEEQLRPPLPVSP